MRLSYQGNTCVLGYQQLDTESITLTNNFFLLDQKCPNKMHNFEVKS